MDKLKIFDNRQFGKVRMVLVDGLPYAVGNDIAEALGYQYPADAIRNNCKGSKVHRVLTAGGTQAMKVIPEGDIYRLIVKAADQSQNLNIKRKAEEFERWIFDKVLPEIRRNGMYQLPSNYVEALRALADSEEEKSQLQKENQFLKPKAEQHDVFLSANNAQSVSQVAKTYGWGRNRLFKFLRQKKILMSGGSDHNLPYQQYIDRGYFKIKESQVTMGGEFKNVTTTQITAKGVEYIGKLLKTEGLIEKISG